MFHIQLVAQHLHKIGSLEVGQLHGERRAYAVVYRFHLQQIDFLLNRVEALVCSVRAALCAVWPKGEQSRFEVLLIGHLFHLLYQETVACVDPRQKTDGQYKPVLHVMVNALDNFHLLISKILFPSCLSARWPT